MASSCPRTIWRQLCSSRAPNMAQLECRRNSRQCTKEQRRRGCREEGMDARTRADQLRAAGNPLFNDRKLKLGTFCSNLRGGGTMSSIDGILQAKWPDTLTLARMADEMEFEAIVPVGRWKGFGGAT